MKRVIFSFIVVTGMLNFSSSLALYEQISVCPNNYELQIRTFTKEARANSPMMQAQMCVCAQAPCTEGDWVTPQSYYTRIDSLPQGIQPGQWNQPMRNMR